MNRLNLILCGLLLCFSPLALAQKISFNNIDSDELKRVVGDFSADFMHTTVSGASALGSIFGFELGVVGGQTATPNIGAFAREVDPGLKADPLYFGSALAQISVPLGLTVEANLVPKVGSDDFKFSNLGLGAKWTLTQTLLNWPFSMALRGTVTRTEVSFRQTVSSVQQNLKFTNSQQAFSVVFSKNLILLEPYVTAGFASANGELSGAAIFNGDLAGASSASGKNAGGFYGGGVEVKLLILKIGAEYMRLYDTNRLAGKVTIYF